MSHENVLYITLACDKVMVESAAGDEHSPRFRTWEAERLTEIYNSHGLKALVKEILYHNFTGWFVGNTPFACSVKRTTAQMSREQHRAIYLQGCEDAAFKDHFTEMLYSRFHSQA